MFNNIINSNEKIQNKKNLRILNNKMSY